MLNVVGSPARYCDGVSRRSFLQVGSLAVGGLTLPGLMEAEATAGKKSHKSVIMVYLSGGLAHQDTFDLKPNAPAEVKGEFKPINTNVPGVQFGEHLPKLAKLTDRLAVIRTVTHKEGDHLRAALLMRTGYPHDNVIDYPIAGCVLAKELSDGKSPLPRFVSLHPHIRDLVPMSHGFLPARYAPVEVQVGDPAFRPVAEGDVDPKLPGVDAFKRVDKDKGEAMRKAVERAFDLRFEKEEVRDAYGRTPFGQGCLLARRLVEVGVPVVEVVMGGWDTHADNFKATERLCKTLDPAFASLVKDLEDRKLLDNTVVVWMGEFGRTPRINLNKGRDHFPLVSSVVLAGGKLKRGVVVGKSSADGFKVEERPVTVQELYATIYSALDVDPGQQLLANNGEKVRLVPKGTKAVAEVMK